MRYGSISFTLSNLLSRTFSNLNTDEELARMIKFNEKHKELGTAKNVFKELIETVQTNSEYLNLSYIWIFNKYRKTRFLVHGINVVTYFLF